MEQILYPQNGWLAIAVTAWTVVKCFALIFVAWGLHSALESLSRWLDRH